MKPQKNRLPREVDVRTGLWGSSSSWWCSCSLRVIGLRWPLKVPSYHNFSMILSCKHTTAVSLYLKYSNIFLTCSSVSVTLHALRLHWGIIPPSLGCKSTSPRQNFFTMLSIINSAIKWFRMYSKRVKQPDRIIYSQHVKPIFHTRWPLKSARYFSKALPFYGIHLTYVVNWYFMIVQCNCSTCLDMFVTIPSMFFPSRNLPLRGWYWEIFQFSPIQYLVKKMVASASVVWGWRASWTYFKSWTPLSSGNPEESI